MSTAESGLEGPGGKDGHRGGRRENEHPVEEGRTEREGR